MTIERLKLERFKCFKDSGDIRLAPLTVIFGRNNSGKSSILHSLLILRQSFDSPLIGSRQAGGLLNLRGPYYQAGSFSDLVHLHKTSDRVVVELDVLSPTGKSPTTFSFQFCADEPDPPRLIRLAISRLGAPIASLQRGAGKGGPYELTLGRDRVGLAKAANVQFGVERFLPIIGDEPQDGETTRQSARRTARSSLDSLEATVREIRAVGAFRTRPKREYEYEGTVSRIPDLQGGRVIQ